MQKVSEQQNESQNTKIICVKGKSTSEQNLLRTLLDLMPDFISVKDRAGRNVWVNRAKLDELGLDRFEDAIGKTAFDFFDRASAENFQKDEDQVIQTGQPVINRREKIVEPDGKVQWHLTNKVPWRDEDGNILGLVIISRDITNQMLAEIKLVDERNLLRTVIDNLPDAIYVKDINARKILVNATDARNLGCKTEAEALGKNDFDFFPKEIAQKFFEDDQLVLQKGEAIVNREEKAVLSDGHSVWLLTAKVPWRDAQGNIIGLVGIGRDITDKKNLEMQLLQSQRMESVGRLATGIAHDLNNILAPILISTALLRSQIAEEGGLKMLAMIEASAKRGADIVKQVLLFGRGAEGQRISINLKHFIKDVARIATETFDRSIQVETQFAGGILPVVGDPSQLHQLLLNLCFNARDAMPSGGKLTLAARNFTANAEFIATHSDARPGQYIILEIADTGRGIPRENLDQVFEPFFTTKHIGKGAGLGLSTVLSIVKSHGGFIHVESEVGKGSTFQIYLPAQQEQNSEKAKL